MVPYPHLLSVGSLSFSALALAQGTVSSDTAFSTVLNASESLSTSAALGGFSESLPLPNLASLGGEDNQSVSEQPSGKTLLWERIKEGEFTGPIDPPTFWLNSLDSLRCTEDTVAPGDSTCEGPDAWRRTSNGFDGVFFTVVGDTGSLGDVFVKVAEQLAGVCSSLPISFVSLVGDNFYPSGVRDVHDPKFYTNFEIPLSHASLKRVAFFPVLGNHDYKLNPQAQVQRYYALCPTCKQPQDWNSAKVRWRFPNTWYFSRLSYNNVPVDLSASPPVTNTEQMQRRKYATRQPGNENSMVIVNVHLDSQMLTSSPDSAGKQLVFLEKVLKAAAAEADWVFVHQHHPLFTDATLSRNDKAFQDMLVPLLSRYNVDVLFAGHEHLLSLFEVNAPDGSGGFVQVISGSGSKLISGTHSCYNMKSNSWGGDAPPCPRRNCLFQKVSHGFVLVELSLNQMRLHFIDAVTGEVVFHTTYESKKAARLLLTAMKVPATGDGTIAGFKAEASSAYPTILLTSNPKELSDPWRTNNAWYLFLMMVPAVSLLFCIVCYWRCDKIHNFLFKRNFLPNWGCCRRQRQSFFEMSRLPALVGAARVSPSNRTADVSPPDAVIPVAAVVPDATSACEQRKQKSDDSIFSV